MIYDTVVIGAGMAGISAARTLSKASSDRKIVVLEAKSRIGGRVWTAKQPSSSSSSSSSYSADDDCAGGGGGDVDTWDCDFPIEYGAEFIHGNDNVTTHQLIKEAGLHVIPVDRYSPTGMYWGNPKAEALENSEWKGLIERLLNDYDDLVAHQSLPYDTSLGEYLRIQKGYSTDELVIADVLLAQTWCASIYTLSIQDLQQELLQNSAGENDNDQEYRIQEGYSSLVKYMSQNLEIHTSTPVSCITQDMENNTVTVTATTTGQERCYMARTCIVTVPLNVLKYNKIRFLPELSIEKQCAIKAIKMEAGTRLIYQFQEQQQFWNSNLTYMLTHRQGSSTTRWWTPGYGHRKNSSNNNEEKAVNNVICAFATSDYANHLDQLSEEDALTCGLQDLSILLDVPIDTLKENLIKSKRISWSHDPYTLGAYAHIPPGAGRWARQQLAKPDGLVFFAGEATAYHSTPQTVHGAIDTGVRAANEILFTEYVNATNPGKRKES